MKMLESREIGISVVAFLLYARSVFGATCTGPKFFSGSYSFYFLSTFYCSNGCCGLYKQQYCCAGSSYYTTKIPIIRTIFPTLKYYYSYYNYYYYYTYDSLNIGAVVGGIVGGLMFLILCGTGMALLCTHLGRKSTRRGAVITAGTVVASPPNIENTTPPMTTGHQMGPQTPMSHPPQAYPQLGQPSAYSNTQPGQPPAYSSTQPGQPIAYSSTQPGQPTAYSNTQPGQPTGFTNQLYQANNV